MQLQKAFLSYFPTMPFKKNRHLCYYGQSKKTTNMKETIAKAAEGNKAAAARARKATLELEKLGKEFRKQSIAELK